MNTHFLIVLINASLSCISGSSQKNTQPTILISILSLLLLVANGKVRGGAEQSLTYSFALLGQCCRCQALHKRKQLGILLRISKKTAKQSSRQQKEAIKKREKYPNKSLTNQFTTQKLAFLQTIFHCCLLCYVVIYFRINNE